MNLQTQRVPIYLGISRFLFLIGIFLMLLSISGVVASMVLALLFDVPLKEMSALLQEVPRTARHRQMQLLFQGITALGGFIVSATIFIKLVERQSFKILNPKPKLYFVNFLLASVIFIAVMPFSSALIEWNVNLDFPSFMNDFETWARAKEARLAELTFFLVKFQDVSALVLGLVVIGILPGIGEELIFRGILQRNMAQYFSTHIAIFISAAIFSAIHLQFYGFFPRMFLGILLGYLYFWSGNLWVPIWAHILNNSFTLCMVYLYQQGLVSYNLMQVRAMPWYWVLLSVLITSVGLYLFHQYNQKNKISSINHLPHF